MKKKKILNSNGIRRILRYNFPDLTLEIRTRQFLDSFIIVYLKEILKGSCLLTKHRKRKILQACDLKEYIAMKSKNIYNFSPLLEKLILKKKK